MGDHSVSKKSKKSKRSEDKLEKKGERKQKKEQKKTPVESPIKEKTPKNKKRSRDEDAVAESPKQQKKQSNTTPHSDRAAVEKFRTANRISVSLDTKEAYPVLSFDECRSRFPESDALLNAFCADFASPTPIQAQCWPIGLAGRDLIGIAETGSGKTLGFLLPAMARIGQQSAASKKSRRCQPSILVLAPTRELALQSDLVCNEVSSVTGVSSICVAGGMDRKEQTNALRQGCQVVVATPGRLISLLETKECDLSRCQHIILDEADRMLDMGFEPDIKKIMSYLPTQRQTAMFSATWPEEIRALAGQYLTKPVKIIIGSDDLTANSRVTQIVEVVDGREKDRRLTQLLTKYHDQKNRILIFCLYKKEAARVESSLWNSGWNVTGIHGDMGQTQRTQAFNNFKDGTVPLLVATDVASRGLDIPNVEYVINYTFPLTIEDYIHRIGRTGRAKKTGVAHTFFTVAEKGKAGDLCRVLREANQEVPSELEKFGPSIKKKKEHSMYGTHYEDGAPMKEASRVTFDSDSE